METVEESIATSEERRAGVVISQPDVILFLLLYSVKFVTLQQAKHGAYFDYSLKGVTKRFRKLEGAGFIRIIRRVLPPGSESEFDPSSGFFNGNLRGRVFASAAPEAGRPRVRDAYTWIAHLAPRGEAYVRDLLGDRYRPAEPVKPNPRENWEHELSIARLLVDQLDGSHATRLGELEKWTWLTTYRGYTEDSKVIADLPAGPHELKNLTPDSVVFHEERPERVFIEYDRGTKVIARERTNPKYRDSIRATLEAYTRLITMFYGRYFEDGRPPLVLYVVRDADRRHAILELAQKEYRELPLRVRTHDTVARWFQDWLAGDDAPASRPVEVSKETATKAYVNQLEQSLKRAQTRIEEALRVFAGLRAIGAKIELTPEWQELLKRGEGKVYEQLVLRTGEKA